jgi:exodeoxyribonuclease VII large subunit
MPKGALSVTQFVTLVNQTLDMMESVTVEGEVEEFKIINNKWVVFDLKDKESLVKCFMTTWQLRTAIEDGMLVRVVGQPKLRNKGFFSFVLESVQPAGEGALRRAFELLKQKLTAEGVFAPERKRLLPRFPERIALITSRDAAAYGDFMKVLRARHGGLTIYFIHTAVQGEDAPAQVISALERANTGPEQPDAIVMVRGGGSMEDLQAFNDELVVRAVASSRLPIIVGVGHERDITLAELAADVRASTPSNAAELLIRSRDEIMLELAHYRSRLQTSVRQKLSDHQAAIAHALTVLRRRVTTTRQRVSQTITSLVGWRLRLVHIIQRKREHIVSWRTTLATHTLTTLRYRQENTKQLLRVLHSLSPDNILKRGYSITRTAKGRVVKRTQDAPLGTHLVTQVADGTILSTVGRLAKKQLELGI